MKKEPFEPIIDKKHKSHHELFIFGGLSLAILILFTFVFGADARDYAMSFKGVAFFAPVAFFGSLIAIVGGFIYRADPNKDWLRVVAIALAIIYALLIGIPSAQYKQDPKSHHPKEIRK
jgi:hypothetical protein